MGAFQAPAQLRTDFASFCVAIIIIMIIVRLVCWSHSIWGRRWWCRLCHAWAESRKTDKDRLTRNCLAFDRCLTNRGFQMLTTLDRSAIGRMVNPFKGNNSKKEEKKTLAWNMWNGVLSSSSFFIYIFLINSEKLRAAISKLHKSTICLPYEMFVVIIHSSAWADFTWKR